MPPRPVTTLLDSSFYDLRLGSSSKITCDDNRVRAKIFLNEDILRLIFQHFDLSPGQKGARKHLLSAVKTCKAFVEPALDSLWHTLPSLLPLLLLLPSAQVIGNNYFVDDLTTDNWERFEIHARRVRTLYMEKSLVIIPPTVYLRISGLRGGSFLTGLKEIYIPSESTSIDLSSIILLAFGALDSVTLNKSAISDRSFYMPFLTLLASKSPQLSHLVLHGGNMSLEPVYRFTNLQRLELMIYGIDFHVIKRLGDLVNLSDLTIIGTTTPNPLPAIVTDIPTFFSPSSRGSFRKLRKLHVSGDLDSASWILSNVNLASVVTLVIDEVPGETIIMGGGPMPIAKIIWRHIFIHISECHALEDIEINQYNRHQRHECSPLSASCFSPLFNLSNMKTLVIQSSSLSGSDDDFRLLACAFPKLKKLVVPRRYCSPGRTLACLFYFSQNCPDLREIHISLASNAHTNLDALKNLPRHTIPVNHQHQLQKLFIESEFGAMQPIYMVQIAQFLNLIFPNIVILEAYNEPKECGFVKFRRSSDWSEIQRIRLALQSTWLNTLRQTTPNIGMTSTERAND